MVRRVVVLGDAMSAGVCLGLAVGMLIAFAIVLIDDWFRWRR